MIITTNQLILNGQQFSMEEILRTASEKISNPSVPEWERELYIFLQEWFSPSLTIKVQTSGSTGEPASIELPKAVMISSAQRTIDYFHLREADRLLLSLPCRFIAGKMMVVRAVVGKMDLVTVDPTLESDILLSDHLELGAMVPNQVAKLLESPLGRQQIENIRNLLIGGGSIPASLELQLRGLKTQVVSTYGMTETASHIAIRPLSGEKRSDVYECLPGITVSLSENDCLQIHVPGLETFYTKDIARVISPIRFIILGRADNVIISGGIKYWPETLEKKLEGMIVQRYVISSLPDEKLGEKLVLVIEGAPLNIEMIQNKIVEVLPPFERPRRIYFLESFPETDNGKLRRNEIRKKIEALD